jgi:hypothetical protein
MKRNCILFCTPFIFLFIILYYENFKLYYGVLAICAILNAISMLLGTLVNQITESKQNNSQQLSSKGGYYDTKSSNLR